MGSVTYESLKASKDDLNRIYQILLDTSNKLILRYKEIGDAWLDKKYKKTGEKMRLCLEVLLKNTNTLKNTIRTLGVLMDKVMEYENAKILDFSSTSNGFVSSLRSMTNGNAEADIFRCGDVLVKDGALSMSIDYRNLITNRISSATDKARQVYKTYIKRVVIQNANFSGQAGFYSEDFNKGIYYNARDDVNGSNFFTYVGEMIDNTSSPSFSSSEAFTDSLISEINNYNGNTAPLRNLLKSGSNLNRRAFSTFFEASMGNVDLLNEIKTNFPNSYQVFNNIMDDMIGIERGERF